jgi:hypothetical protein
MRSGRLLVRAAAVAALLIAAVTTVIVLTRSGAAPTSAGATSGSAALLTKDKSVAAHGTIGTSTVEQAAKQAIAKTSVAKTPVKPAHVTHTPKAKAKAKTKVAIPAPHTTPVAILNGGTSQGAAAALASRLRSVGYPVPVVGNAGRRDLPMAIEYSAGLGPAARALAKHVGAVQYVTPLEGPNRNLSGARLLVIIGD